MSSAVSVSKLIILAVAVVGMFLWATGWLMFRSTSNIYSDLYMQYALVAIALPGLAMSFLHLFTYAQTVYTRWARGLLFLAQLLWIIAMIIWLIHRLTIGETIDVTPYLSLRIADHMFNLVPGLFFMCTLCTIRIFGACTSVLCIETSRDFLWYTVGSACVWFFGFLILMIVGTIGGRTIIDIPYITMIRIAMTPLALVSAYRIIFMVFRTRLIESQSKTHLFYFASGMGFYYLADLLELFQRSYGQKFDGSISDMCYLLSFLLIGLGVILFDPPVTAEELPIPEPPAPQTVIRRLTPRTI